MLPPNTSRTHAKFLVAGASTNVALRGKSATLSSAPLRPGLVRLVEQGASRKGAAASCGKDRASERRPVDGGSDLALSQRSSRQPFLLAVTRLGRRHRHGNNGARVRERGDSVSACRHQPHDVTAPFHGSNQSVTSRGRPSATSTPCCQREARPHGEPPFAGCSPELLPTPRRSAGLSRARYREIVRRD